jgi:DNA repair exonuclease SbcCD ATPase subunit
MPTQEERLTALEQTFATFQREIASHIQETDENTTIMLGVIRHQGQDIKRIVQRLETIDQRLNTIEQRLDQLETKVEQRLDRLETKSNEHTELLHQILARLPKTL